MQGLSQCGMRYSGRGPRGLGISTINGKRATLATCSTRPSLFFCDLAQDHNPAPGLHSMPSVHIGGVEMSARRTEPRC